MREIEECAHGDEVGGKLAESGVRGNDQKKRGVKAREWEENEKDRAIKRGDGSWWCRG